jgi:hypothetical protein
MSAQTRGIGIVKHSNLLTGIDAFFFINLERMVLNLRDKKGNFIGLNATLLKLWLCCVIGNHGCIVARPTMAKSDR